MTSKHRFFTLGIVLALVVGTAGLWIWWNAHHSRVTPESRRPNIVFILVDDLRWDELGCVGHPYVKTPNIDRIASVGLRFTNAFVATPLCSPSRASILTGQYAHKHGIIDNTDRSARSHELITFPRLLHDAGYETAYVGKWHMGVDDRPRPGFDYWFSVKGQGRYFDPDINENGQRRKIAGYVTDIFNERAADFIRKERSKPFCLYVAHKAVHPDLTQNADGSISDQTARVFEPAERHKRLYAGAAVPRRRNAFIKPVGKPALERKIGDLPPLGKETGTDDETIRNRQRMLASVDDGVGLLLQALEETGQLDNTLFVFTSDHGYFYGEHGLSVERRLAYEEAIRIPLLMRFPPWLKAASTTEAYVQTIDFAPTLLELGGVKPENVHGRSLAPLLKGEPMEPRSSLLIEHHSDKVFPRVVKMGYQAVRTDRWKYIHYTDLSGMDELYDLKKDPYEMTNLIAHPDAQATLEELKEELKRLLSHDPKRAS